MIRRYAILFAAFVGLFGLVVPAAAQRRPELKIQAPGATDMLIRLSHDRGFAALEARELTRLGWTALATAAGTDLTGPGGVRVRVQEGSPYFTWGDQVLQLADAPYTRDGSLRVPLQLLTDFFPKHLPRVYTFDAGTLTLRVAPGGSGRGVGGPPGSDSPPPPPRVPAPTRVVVIDAGHGGSDPGAIGPGNVREKNVALGIAVALAEQLRDTERMEVHLLRDDDSFIPLWDRGPEATRLKGERPGVFVSIHANSLPTRRSARGYETYFLSDARTDDERRVAAIENAPLRVESGPAPDDDLDFILRELTNLDHTHWSSLLAEMVQGELAGFHPGPNRGVKQAPLAVLTNVAMPGVLVEIGFVSNAEEAALIGTGDFQRSAADALAKGIRDFLDRYPPANGVRGGGGGGS